MEKHLVEAGLFRKSHKSVKTVPPPESASGSSSTALTAALASTPPPSSDEEAGTSTGVPEPVARQWWKRAPDSKTRKLAEKIVVMKAAGRTTADIAKRLDTTPATVHQALYVARKNGWLDEDDEPVDLEADLALNIDRKVVRNIDASLDGQMTNWQTHEMTIAAAKGRGIFKNHEVSKNDGPQAMTAVAIQVIMPAVGAQDQLPQVQEDQMGGQPAFIDGELDEV